VTAAREANKMALRMTDKLVVLVTCRSAKEADRIARALVKDRLAACGNILQNPVRSIYRLHSYEVPEIIALPIAAGSQGYLSWLAESVAPRKKR
jgi:periplasmic divalent cation tolerance protein